MSDKESDDTHPVWDVYDQYRTARLNVKYYSKKLEVVKRQNFWIELALAVAAPSSAVAGLWFWETDIGSYTWKGFAIIAACLAVIKPLLGLTTKIQKLEGGLSRYRLFHHDLQKIVVLISQERKYLNKFRNEFKSLLDNKREIIEQEMPGREDKKLKNRCQDEVLRELPAGSFFVPKED